MTNWPVIEIHCMLQRQLSLPKLTCEASLDLLFAADECTSPQVCNAVGTAEGVCVDPVAAGAGCQKAAASTAAGELCQHKLDKCCRKHASPDLDVSCISISAAQSCLLQHH